MNDTKTRNTDNREPHPPIGNFIHYHILQQKIKKADLSRYLGIAPTSLNDYFKRDSLQFEAIWKLSQAMNHNFVAQLGDNLPIPYETKKEKVLLKELAEKNELIKEMEIKLGVYEKVTSQR